MIHWGVNVQEWIKLRQTVTDKEQTWLNRRYVSLPGPNRQVKKTKKAKQCGEAREPDRKFRHLRKEQMCQIVLIEVESIWQL